MSLLSLSSNFLISYIPNQMTNFVEFWCDFVIGDVYAISYNFNECTPHHHLMFISNFKEKSVTIPCLWHGHIVEAFLYVILKNVYVCVCVCCTKLCLFLVCNEFFWFISMNIRCLICAFHSKLVCDSAAVSIFSISPHTYTHTRLTHSMSSEMWKDSTISVFVAGGVWWYKEWIRRRHVAIRCGIHNLNLQNFCFAAYLFAGSFAALFLCVMLPTQYNHHFSAVSFLIYCLILIIMSQFLVSLASISLLIQIIFPLVMYEWLLSKTFAYLSSLAWLFMSFL